MKNRVFIYAAVLLLTGCQGLNHIYSNYDRSVDFKQYQTYAWLPDNDNSQNEFNNQVIRNNARNYFNTCMAMRGYKIDTAAPDILIDLIISIKQEEKTVITEVRPFPPGWYYHNPFYHPYPTPGIYLHPFSYNYHPPKRYVVGSEVYTKGTITLNIIDRKLNRQVWTGTATGDIYDLSNVEYNLYPAIYDMLDRYPIKPIKGRKKSTDYE